MGQCKIQNTKYFTLLLLVYKLQTSLLIWRALRERLQYYVLTHLQYESAKPKLCGTQHSLHDRPGNGTGLKTTLQTNDYLCSYRARTRTRLDSRNALNLSLYSYIELVSKLGSWKKTHLWINLSMYLHPVASTFFGDVRFCLQYTEI